MVRGQRPAQGQALLPTGCCWDFIRITSCSSLCVDGLRTKTQETMEDRVALYYG